jgi:hypothetical protein
LANGKNTPFRGITRTPASGVGANAYYIITPGFGTGLNVKKASSALQVSLYGFPLDRITSMEKTLAEKALAKMECSPSSPGTVDTGERAP